jgi:Na+/proline symporter
MPEAKPFSMTAEIAIIDWCIIGIYFAFSIFLGIYFTKRATRSTSEYFATGKGMPWWLLGTSMVATTFAADTPLAVSGLILKQGIAGNWYWWCTIPMGIIGVFFFSRLWRRSGILTDTELVSIRYSGSSASFLRGFKAIYFAIPYNCLVIGWVNLAMANIIGMTFGVNKLQAVMICFFITMAYSAVSGLWGVIVTDFFQFILAMGMCIYLAFAAVSQAGGMDAIIGKMNSIYGSNTADSMLSVIPAYSTLPPLYDSILSPLMMFFIYMGMVWWTTGNTDGGTYIAQRLISAKNEKHSFLGFLWFNIAHFCLRPWPWIVVGLVAAVSFPYIADPETGKANPELGYIAVMISILPKGALGAMLAAFFAAYMSTISTQLNWGASYLVNDFYKPFIRKNADEKHYVRMSVLATIFIALTGAAVTFVLRDIFRAWLILSAANAGIGFIYIARWYWWRINAWSEISAIFTAVLSFTVVYIASDYQWTFPLTLVITAPVTIFTALLVTMLTPQVDEEKLVKFYRQVRPGGAGWKRISSKITEAAQFETLASFKNVINALIGMVVVFCTLIGVGKIILGNHVTGVVLLIISITGCILIWRRLGSEKWG